MAALNAALEKRLGEAWQLRAGAKYTYNDMHHEALYRYLRPEGWETLDAYSYVTDYTEHITAAYAAATRLGLDAARCAAALATYRTTGMRQHIVEKGGITFIEDCYNANPDSMKAALAMFKEYPCKRRFALLGDMLELGGMSAPAHEELGRQAAEAGLTALVTYGPEAARTARAAKDAGLADVVHAEDYQQAADALLARMAPGDALLVKASRGMALEKALALFYPVCAK